MVVVIVLIGIMAAMIIPEMKGTFDDALLRSTSRDLVNVFSLASSRAVSLNQSYRVRFDPPNGSLSRSNGRFATAAATDFVPLKDVSGAEGRLDSRIAVEVQHRRNESSTGNNSESRRRPDQSSPDAISFYPDGTADAAEIRLRDRAGFQLLLQLNPVTARVHIIEPHTRMNAPPLNSGFSLIEVMVAILILGVALAGLTHGITTALGFEQGIGMADDRRAVRRRKNRDAPRRGRAGKRRDRRRLRRGAGSVSLETNHRRRGH